MRNKLLNFYYSTTAYLAYFEQFAMVFLPALMGYYR